MVFLIIWGFGGWFGWSENRATKNKQNETGKNKILFLGRFRSYYFFAFGCTSPNKQPRRISKVRYNQSDVSIERLTDGVWDTYYSKSFVKNGVYSRRDADENLFDLFLPMDDNGSVIPGVKPLIIMLHSGAFLLGNKRNHVISQYARDFSRAGFAVASINYNKMLFNGYSSVMKNGESNGAYIHIL